MPSEHPTAAKEWTPVVASLPSAPKARRACLVAIAMELGLPLGDVLLLAKDLPVHLPRRLAEGRAQALIDLIITQGGRGTVEAVAPGLTLACGEHPAFDATSVCSRCDVPTCLVCAARSLDPVLCPRCLRRKRRLRTFYHARIAVLLLVLAGVSMYAWLDFGRRRARTSWEGPIRVAIVLLQTRNEPVAGAEAISARIPALQERLRQEMARYRPISFDPIAFRAFGPVDVDAPPPRPAGDGIADLAREAYLLYRYTRDVDSRAGVDGAFDSRIYVVMRRPSHGKSLFVDGFSESGGRIGTVDVEFDETMVDYALFVAVHELFHTIGATDKYDATGKTRVPDGLAEPGLQPLYPQHKADVMARMRPVTADSEATPGELEELGVGPATAKEVGWLQQE